MKFKTMILAALLTGCATADEVKSLTEKVDALEKKIEALEKAPAKSAKAAPAAPTSW